MNRQKPILLNLTKQEADCLNILFDNFALHSTLTWKEVQPCLPFVKRLQEKIHEANGKKIKSILK